MLQLFPALSSPLDALALLPRVTLAAQSATPGVSTACSAALHELATLSYVDLETSLGMLGASSTVPNNEGDYYACKRHDDSAEYCLIQVRAGWTVLSTQAACVPTACSAQDVRHALNLSNAEAALAPLTNLSTIEGELSKVARALNGTAYEKYVADAERAVEATQAEALTLEKLLMGAQAKFKAAGTNLSVTCGEHYPDELGAGGWATLVVMGLLLLLVLAGSTLRLLDERRAEAAAAERAALVVPLTSADEPTKRVARRGAGAQVLLAFSVKENLAFLLQPSPLRRFTALEGVRAISMFWIILAHTLDFQLYIGWDEPFPAEEANTLDKASFLPVLSASYAVDSFFVLSGFLGAHVLLRRPKHIGLPAFVLRYLRLTPTLALLLAFYATLAPQLSHGPHWFKMAQQTQGCHKWWWSNLIYTNNLAPQDFDQSCMPWTWYLACDTQMFLASLPLLALRASKRPALKTAAAVLCAGMVVAAIVSTWVLLPAEGVSMSPFGGKGPSLQDVVYDKPYCRMGPYFIGTLLAFSLEETPAATPTAPAARRRGGAADAALFVGATLVISALVWLQYKNTDWWTTQGHYAYTALSRPVFALALSALLWLCVTGRAPPLNGLLSLGVWDLPAKLTYSAYLVHPIIIRAYLFSSIHVRHYSPLYHISDFLAMAVYAYFCAFLIALLIELPSANLIKLLMPRPQKKTVVEPDSSTAVNTSNNNN